MDELFRASLSNDTTTPLISGIIASPFEMLMEDHVSSNFI